MDVNIALTLLMTVSLLAAPSADAARKAVTK
jgi:hypothetical protein